MKSPKHRITANIEGNVVDITYIGELEIHTVSTHHFATYRALPGPSRILLYLALTAKIFGHLWSILYSMTKN